MENDFIFLKNQAIKPSPINPAAKPIPNGIPPIESFDDSSSSSSSPEGYPGTSVPFVPFVLFVLFPPV